MSHRRPFRLLPLIAHNEQLGWAYLRWARRIWRVPALDRRAPPRGPRMPAPPLTTAELAVICVCLWILLIVGINGLAHQVMEIWP